MSKIEEIIIINPYGIADTVGKITTTSATSLRLFKCIQRTGRYAFQIWIRSIENLQPCNPVKIDINGDITSDDLTTEWKQIVIQGNIDIINQDFIDIHFPQGSFYVYEAQFEYGDRPSDWKPSVRENESMIKQTARMISLMVESDDGRSEVVLTDNMVQAITKQFVIKSPNGTRTVISGGTISTDLVQSNDYEYTGGIYSSKGTMFGLEGTGFIRSKNFAITEDGNAYLKGNIVATGGYIGDELQGFQIGNKAISNGKASLLDSSEGIYLGTDGISFGINGKVSFLPTGEGTIGGFHIGSTSLYNSKPTLQNSSNGVYVGIDGISLGSGDTSLLLPNGSVNFKTGTIGPWNLDSTSIWKGNSTFGSASGMYFGNSGISITDKFKVTNTGVITATSGTFSGTINAISGTFQNGIFSNCTFNDLNDQGYGITISRSGDTSVFKAYGSENITQITGDGGVRVTSKGNYVYAALTDSGVMENGSLISSKYAAKSHSHSYLPLSGGQMTGNINMGHRHYLSGKTDAGGSYDISGIGIGGTDNVNCVYLGNTTLRTYLRGATVRLKDGTAVTSNLDKKHDVYSLEDSKYEDMFDFLKPVSYKLNDGDSGRDHLGFGAQHVVAAIEKAGLTTQEYGAVIIDYVDGQAVDYCLRYEEFIALNTHMIQTTRKDLNYQVGRIDMQEAIINDLQSRLWQAEKEIKELKQVAQ